MGKWNTCVIRTGEALSLKAMMKAQAGRILMVDGEALHACDKYTGVVCCTVESPIEIMGTALGAESIGWPLFPL